MVATPLYLVSFDSESLIGLLYYALKLRCCICVTLDSADDKEDNFYPFSFSSPSLAYTCFPVSGAGQIMYYLVGLLGSHLTLRSLPIKSFQSGCNLKRLQEWLVFFLLPLVLR